MDVSADGEGASGNISQVSALRAYWNGVQLTAIGSMGGEDEVVLGSVSGMFSTQWARKKGPAVRCG